MSDAPLLVLIGGPNGAGKTTLATVLLPTLGVSNFVNADSIARGMSDDPGTVAAKAGRAMLLQLKALSTSGEDFAFESTLASRSFARFMADTKKLGYRCLLYYIWLPTPEQAILRVNRRFQNGGHLVAESDVRRRHGRSARNFFDLYRPLSDAWIVFENPDGEPHQVVAAGAGDEVDWVGDEELWNSLCLAGQG